MKIKIRVAGVANHTYVPRAFFKHKKKSRSLHFLNSFLKHRKIVCKGLNKQYLHNPTAVNRTSILKVQNLNIRYADFVNQFLSPQKYQLQ